MRSFRHVAFMVTSVTVVLFASLQTGHSKKAQPPAANDGDPTTIPAGQTCIQCHSGIIGNANDSVLITFSDGQNSYNIDNFSYVPGTNYTVTFHPLVSAARYGFQLSALLSSNNSNAGTLTSTSAKTSLATGILTKYIGHKNADTTNTWSFPWAAPATNQGNVVFYFAFVAGNASDTEFGDQVFKGSKTVSADSTNTGLNEALQFPLQVISNAQTHQLNINYPSHQNQSTVTVYNISGEALLQQQIENATGYTQQQVDVSTLSTGIYLVRVTQGAYSGVQKVLIQ